MQYPAQGGCVVFRLRLLRQLQHAMEHGGNNMRMGDAMPGDQAEHLLRIPFIHQHAADACIDWKGKVQREGRCVIERPGDEGGIAFAKSRRFGELCEQRRHRRGLLAIDAFRMAGRAGCVHHLRAEHGIGKIASILSRERLVIRGETINLTPDRELRDKRGRHGCGLDGAASEARIGDECLRLAIVDDIADLRALEVPVDGRHTEAAALTGRNRLHEFGAV